MTVAVIRRLGGRWLPWAGALIGFGSLAWVLRGFDLDRFLVTLSKANFFYLALVPANLIAEQLVRAWKWRQILSPLKLISTKYHAAHRRNKQPAKLVLAEMHIVNDKHWGG